MKYLKIFEKFDKKEGYFKEITEREYDKKLFTSDWGISSDGDEKYLSNPLSLDIDDSEAENIYKMIEPFYQCLSVTLNSEVEDDWHPTNSLVFGEDGDFNLFITKLDDEWYCVGDGRRFKYYLCDQIDGLEECIKHIKE